MKYWQEYYLSLWIDDWKEVFKPDGGIYQFATNIPVENLWTIEDDGKDIFSGYFFVNAGGYYYAQTPLPETSTKICVIQTGWYWEKMLKKHKKQVGDWFDISDLPLVPLDKSA